MNNLQAQLQQIAADFVAGVLDLMGQASLSDFAEPSQNGARAIRSASRPTVTPARTQRGPAQSVRTRPPAPTREAAPRHRASAEEVKRYKDLALSTAKQMPPGFSKGDLMRRTGGKVDMGRFIGLLVDEGLLTRKGERRNARYWLK